jgi:hypothetical protein
MVMGQEIYTGDAGVTICLGKYYAPKIEDTNNFL